MTRIVFIGGGGFSKEVLEIAELTGHEVVGYVGDQQSVLDRPYWGSKATLPERSDEFDAAVITFGFVNRQSIATRAEMVAWLSDNGFKSVPLVSPHAIVAKGAIVEPGSIIAHGATISVDAHIGAHSILNTNAIVGHDTKIGTNVMIAPAAFIGGVATVGDNTLLGPGSMALQGVNIGSYVVVGIGATIIRDVDDDTTVWPTKSKTSRQSHA